MKEILMFFSLGSPGASKETTLRQFGIKINKNNSTDQYRNLLLKDNKEKPTHITSVFFSNNNSRAIRDNILEQEIASQEENYIENKIINHDTPGMTNSMTNFYPKFQDLQNGKKATNVAFWIYTPFEETLKRVYYRQQYNGIANGADFISFCFNNSIKGHKDIIEQLQPNQTYIIDNSKNGGYPSICASIIKDKSSDVKIHNLDGFLSFVQSMNENLIYGTTDPVPVYKKYTYKEQNEKERILVGLKNFCKLYEKCIYKNIQFYVEKEKLVVKYKNKNIEEISSFDALDLNEKTKDILNYIIVRNGYEDKDKETARIEYRRKNAFIKKYKFMEQYLKYYNGKTKKTIENYPCKINHVYLPDQLLKK